MTRIRATPVIDQIQRGDERVVLVSGRAVRVVGLALPLLDLVTDWVDLPDLVAGLERTFGPAPGGDGEALVRAAAEDLRDEGLVEIDEETVPEQHSRR